MSLPFHSLLQLAGLSVPTKLPNPLIAGVTSDTRFVKKGFLFIGLPGKSVDGGIFWQEAFSAGASAAVIGQEAAKEKPPDIKDSVLVVPSSVAHWAGELSAVFWGTPSSHLNLIGVTGTNGKTTTSHLIEYLSSFCGCPSSLFGTLVNRWPGYSSGSKHTTEFSDVLQAQLASALKAGAQLAAMEVSSHALDQNRVSGCRFSGAIFTNLTQDHLDYHENMEAYFEAKALLFQPPLFDNQSPQAVVNIDNIWGQKLAKRLGDKCWKSSLLQDSPHSSKPELTISDLKVVNGRFSGVLSSPVGHGEFSSPLLGRFNLMNLLQAVGVLLQHGFPISDLLSGINSFPGVPGRMERVQLGDSSMQNKLPMVLVDYAHTPDGLENALIASRPFVKGKLICLFGCGGDRDRGKRPQMGQIASSLSDLIVVTSDNPRTEDPQQIINDILKGISIESSKIIEPDRATAIDNAISIASANDLILIAGKGHEDYQILGVEKIYFDDRKQAMKALRLKNRS